MSATNTTTNYNLPIFIETDKPAWLVDFNGAMRAIDAQMKTNADAIATKSPILTFNDTAEIDFTKSGDIITANLASGVSDKVGRALVTPIAPPAAEQLVAINTTGAQDALAIGTGLELSNNTLSAIDLNLTDTGTAQLTLTGGAGSISTSMLQYAFNSDHTVGKLYGAININSVSTNTNYTINTNLTVSAPDAAYDIIVVMQGYLGLGPVQGIFNPTIHIDTSGSVSITFSTYYLGSGNAYIRAFPCLLFFSNFGDTPIING